MWWNPLAHLSCPFSLSLRRYVTRRAQQVSPASRPGNEDLSRAGVTLDVPRKMASSIESSSSFSLATQEREKRRACFGKSLIVARPCMSIRSITDPRLGTSDKHTSWTALEPWSFSLFWLSWSLVVLFSYFFFLFWFVRSDEKQQVYNAPIFFSFFFSKRERIRKRMTSRSMLGPTLGCP